MEKLLNLLETLKPGADFKNSKNLIEDGLIDSFDMVNIIANINMEFGIKLSVADILPENFETVEAIEELIKSYQ